MIDTYAKEISNKLDLLVRLAALSILNNKPQKEQIELLGKAGLSPKDISVMVDTTANTVSVTLSKMKKAGKTKSKNKS